MLHEAGVTDTLPANDELQERVFASSKQEQVEQRENLSNLLPRDNSEKVSRDIQAPQRLRVAR